MKKIIGITGNIGMGKSTVAKYIHEAGYDVIDVDKIGHNLLKEQMVIDKISKIFPTAIEKDNINRKKLAKIVFENRDNLSLLNSIVHPLIIDKIKNIINKTDKIIFFDIPLLFELKLEYLFNKIICVWIDADIQLSRIINRDNITLLEAKNRINAQLDIEYKKKNSDYIIYTNNINNVKLQIDNILKEINEYI